jgi:hypothetical protein
MTKIVCLIRPQPPLIYFVNRINECRKVALAVLEEPTDDVSLWTKMKERGAAGTLYALMSRLSRRSVMKSCEATYNHYFGNRWHRLDSEIPLLEVNDINAKTVREQLQQEKPDLILDHGTSLVKKRILETAKLALNLHWGLSPYYRGTFCTDWAIVNWDPYNIGVTIHKLTRIIDGGSILAQRRAVVKPTDTVHSINMQLTVLGTELIIEAINRIEAGEELHFHQQDLSAGYLTRNNQYSDFLRMQIERIEKNNLIDEMLKKPARKERLPIIEI